MMFKVAKLGIAFAAVLAWIVPAAYAGIPDVSNSFFVPQSQLSATSTVAEGTLATRFFRMCPDNDGVSSLPQNARLKIVVKDANNAAIPNIAAADICVLFNGGTAAQGFTGVGADSVIANSTWNPTCPDLRCVAADAPTDATGTTYITFAGADVNNPGFTVRNSNRKWGHYDTLLPVYVLGFQLSGRLTTGSPPGSYELRIKNMDWTGGLGATANQGEAVTSTDFNGVANQLNQNNLFSYWKDFDSSGAVTSTDFNTINSHVGHTCTNPLNP
jgi:hypothetical protein